MPYSQLLGRAFDIVRREPALWVMGVLLALFGGGGVSPGFNWDFGGRTEDFNWQGAPPRLPEWLTVESIGPLIAVLVGAILLIIILGLVIQSIVLAGLIHGADRAAAGRDVRWGELLRAGWSRRGRRLLGLKLLLAIPALVGFVLGVIGFLAAVLPI
ncbi:MAG: hypothetical protein ACRDIB_11100, partial [Ardenticatenaceae bacterium]